MGASTEKNPTLDKRLRALPKELLFDEEDRRYVDEILDEAEYALAFQEICGILSLHRLAAGPRARKELGELGLLLKVDASVWERLTREPKPI